MIIVVSLLLLAVNVFGQIHWDYDHQDEWSKYYEACDGFHESPINIQSRAVKNIPFILGLNNYDKPYVNSTINNDGHTVKVKLNTTADTAPYLTLSAVRNERFILDTIHFHWGENNYEGSEHSVDGLKFSSEIHFVHYNDIYPNLLSARDMEDGLTVIAVFLQLSYRDNDDLTPIIKSIPKILNYTQSSKIKEAINPISLLPIANNAIFRYNGSLTTPPCSETATFLIFANPLPISARQLSMFRQIYGEPDENGKQHQITHNDRNQQPINDRVVQVSTLPVVNVNDNTGGNTLLSSIVDFINAIFG